MKTLPKFLDKSKLLAVTVSAINILYVCTIHKNIIYNYNYVLPNSNALFIVLIIMQLCFAGFSLGLILYNRFSNSRSFWSLSHLSQYLSYCILLVTLFNYIQLKNIVLIASVSALVIFIPSLLLGMVFANVTADLGNQYQKAMFALLTGSSLGVLLYNGCAAYFPFLIVYMCIFIFLQVIFCPREKQRERFLIILSVLAISTFLSIKENWGQFSNAHGKFAQSKRVLTKFAPDGIHDVFFTPRTRRFYLVNDNDTRSPSIIRRKGDIKNVQPEVILPYFIKRYNKSLHIAIGGGQDIVASLFFGVENITAVEISKSRMNIMKYEFAPYSNNLFWDEKVTVINDSGRSFLRKNKEKFDLITITKPGSPVLTNHIVYDYEHELFTEEAMDAYLDALNDGGILFWYIPFTKARILTLRNKYDLLKDNMVIFMVGSDYQRTGKRNRMAAIISKNNDLMHFYHKFKDRFDFVYYPNMEESDLSLVFPEFDKRGESIAQKTDRQFRDTEKPKKLSRIFLVIIFSIILFFIYCRFVLRNTKTFVYLCLGIGYEITLIFFVVWLSLLTISLLKLVPIAFACFFVFGGLGYLHSGKVSPRTPAWICFFLVALFTFISWNDLFLSDHHIQIPVIPTACLLFAVTGYLITFPFGYLVKNEEKFFNALSIDYLGSLLSLPIFIILPHLDYLLALLVVLYASIGIFLIFNRK